MNTFDINNMEHIRCVRDVEMEHRFKDKWTSPTDEYSNVRQYIREVLNGKEQNDNVKKVYQNIVNLVASAQNELANNKMITDNTLKFRITLYDPYTFDRKEHVITLVEWSNDTQTLVFKDSDGNIKETTFEAFNAMLPHAKLV